MGSTVTRPGDLVCRVPGSKVLMTLRRIETADAEPGTISCVYVAPTVLLVSLAMDSDGLERKYIRFMIV